MGRSYDFSSWGEQGTISNHPHKGNRETENKYCKTERERVREREKSNQKHLILIFKQTNKKRVIYIQEAYLSCQKLRKQTQLTRLLV